MKPGDLVQIVNLPLRPGEALCGLFISDEVDIEEWGEQIAGASDCLVFWEGEITPFNKEFLIVISEFLG